jgi:hypothetical protein
MPEESKLTSKTIQNDIDNLCRLLNYYTSDDVRYYFDVMMVCVTDGKRTLLMHCKGARAM